MPTHISIKKLSVSKDKQHKNTVKLQNYCHKNPKLYHKKNKFMVYSTNIKKKIFKL